MSGIGAARFYSYGWEKCIQHAAEAGNSAASIIEKFRGQGSAKVSDAAVKTTTDKAPSKDQVTISGK